MARREHHTPPNREIRVMFEPHRFSPAWIAQAYEQVVPLARRSNPQTRASKSRDAEPSQHAEPREEPPGRNVLRGEETGCGNCPDEQIYKKKVSSPRR